MINMHTRRHILVKKDSKIPHNVTGGHSIAMQTKYVVRYHISKSFSVEYNIQPAASILLLNIQGDK